MLQKKHIFNLLCLILNLNHHTSWSRAMEKKENIVMFPFMAQGHIIPFLALALEIQKKRGCTITFVNTPLNIKNLRSSLPPSCWNPIQQLRPWPSSQHWEHQCSSLPSHLSLHWGFLVSQTPFQKTHFWTYCWAKWPPPTLHSRGHVFWLVCWDCPWVWGVSCHFCRRRGFWHGVLLLSLDEHASPWGRFRWIYPAWFPRSFQDSCNSAAGKPQTCRW